jgi:hypothetical protein
MKLFFARWILLLSILSGVVSASVRERPLQAVAISMVSPTSCPSGICAPGQRLNMQVDFNTSNHQYAGLCFYTPKSWNITTPALFTIDSTGVLSSAPYVSGMAGIPCPDLSGGTPAYNLSGVTGTTSLGVPYEDALGFAFNTGNSTGFILIKVFESTDGITWNETQQTTQRLNIAVMGSDVYVGSNASACGTNSPCYVNSGDDLADGVGTGLKDAINSSGVSNITILGNYPIKSETVKVSNSVTISGINNSRLTYSGSNCAKAMLQIAAPDTTVQNLVIDDGSCNSTDRDLILISNTSGTSKIVANDLINGKNAITVQGSANRPDVEFNQINGNSGFAIDSTSGSGTLLAIANNIYDNAAGQITCHSGDQVDHNFWGSGVSVGTAVSGCTGDDKKRLGAEIVHNTDAPGVNAVKLHVDGSSHSLFSSQIRVQGSSGSDFYLYIMNHGYGGTDNIPFYPPAPSLNACSNFWDIFAAPGASVSPFDLYFKYSLNGTCRDIINASKTCNSGSALSVKPIKWYSTGSSKWTDMSWSCSGNDEAKAAINASDSPKTTDFEFIPMVVGLPIYDDSRVDLLNFTATGSFNSVNVKWKTSNETHIYGYYVQRSLDDTTGFARVTGLQAPLGGGGGDYEITDNTVANGTTYYYRLEVVYSNLNSYFTGPIEVSPMINTITPSLTPTKTLTPTRTITNTSTPYKSSTPYVYKSSTPYVYKSSTPIRYATYTPTRNPSSSVVATKSPTSSGTRTNTPGLLTLTVLAKTPSATPNPFADTPEPASSDEFTFIDQESLATQLFQITVVSTEDALTATSISELLTQTPTPQEIDTITETPEPKLQLPSIINKIASVLSVISGGMMGLILIAIIVLVVFRRYLRNS